MGGAGAYNTRDIERCCSSSSTPIGRASGREERLLGRVCPKGVTTLSVRSHQALDRAEALFKKKEERLREGQEAMAEYEADWHAVREKTARLRAVRLARDAANNQTPILPAKKRSAGGRPVGVL
jgi:hypothetical protein